MRLETARPESDRPLATATPPRPAQPQAAPRRRTKHHQLTETLRDMVARMDPGDRLPTQDELMRRFRVSDTTVLRSLDDLSRAGWIVRRQGSGTFVADRAPQAQPPERAPRGSRAAVTSGLVAVLSRPIDNPLLSDLLQAVETNLSVGDMAPVLIADADRHRRIERARAHWEQGSIVGAIHLGSAVLEGIGDMPVAMIGETGADAGGDFCQVSVDNAAAGRRVAEYLWGLGHRRSAVVTLGNPATCGDAPPTEGVDHLRSAAFRDRWKALGGAWRDDWQVVNRDLLRLDGGERRSVATMRALLEPLFRGDAREIPTAVFAVHDEMATVAIRALEEMELSVPRDVSVIGFNDAGSLAAYFRPTLTTVRTPSPILGTLGVHLLQDLLRNPSQKPRSVRLPPEIIPRESTGPAPDAITADTL